MPQATRPKSTSVTPKKAPPAPPPTNNGGGDQLDTALLLRTLVAFQKGDFSARLPVDHTGLSGKIFDTVNAIFEMNDRMREEFGRISNAVGKEGRISQRASL